MMTKSAFIFLIYLVCALILLGLIPACATMEKATVNQSTPITGNQSAPIFEATDINGRSITLLDYRGKNLIIVFYIGHR